MDTTLVTGGTGVVGSRVVGRLLDEGRPVRVLSRGARRPATLPETVEWAVGDITAGSGLGAALEGVGTVVHCASDSRHGRNDQIAVRHLIDASRAAGSPHVVYISIVGVDKVPLGYYRWKLEVERLLEASGLPCTVLRTTQFHDLLLAIAQRLIRLPVVPVPAGATCQPVDTGEVADRLVELATERPVGRAPDMGGPTVWTITDAVRAVMGASGGRRPLVEIPLPGRTMAAVRSGGLLTPENAVGKRGFREFLADAPVRDRTYGSAQRDA